MHVVVVVEIVVVITTTTTTTDWNRKIKIHFKAQQGCDITQTFLRKNKGFKGENKEETWSLRHENASFHCQFWIELNSDHQSTF